MADNLDKMLTSYFSGKINSAILEKEYDLTHPDSIDENNGGRAQNSYVNSVEVRLMTLESDPELNLLYAARELILKTFKKQREECQHVVETRYRNRSGRHVSWDAIAWTHKVSNSTARRWRDGFKNDLREKGADEVATKINNFFET